MKVISCVAAILSMTANGQEADQDCFHKMNQCIANEDKFRGQTIYNSWRCDRNGDLTYNEYTFSQCKLTMGSRNPLETSSIMNANGQPNCCQKGSLKVKANEAIGIQCKRLEENIEITKATLGANCLNTKSKDLLSDESFVEQCNRKNSCNLQNPNRDPRMNVCAEAELDLEYVCYYDAGIIGVGVPPVQDAASNSRLSRHGSGFPNTDNNNNNGGNSGSFNNPQWISGNANCGGRRIAINTCSNVARNECQGQSSCSYTITHQNSPGCGSLDYPTWYCY